MRRLLTCLLAAAWLAISPTTFAVEFKVDDRGASVVHAAIPSVAPQPDVTEVYSPARSERIAQRPLADETTHPTLPDMSGEVFELDDTELSQSITDPFDQTSESIGDLPLESLSVGGHASACDTCDAGGGPSCTRPGIDTSHVGWKGGDVFTAEDCGNGCSGGGCAGCLASDGTGCTACGDGLTQRGLWPTLGIDLGGWPGPRHGEGCCDCNLDNGCCGSQWFMNGWISQGYTYNTEDPPSGFNTPLTFNDRDEEWMMNQLYLQFGRRARTSGCCWDWGGQIDLMFGSDYFFTQSTGLETRRDGSPRWNSSIGPRGNGASIYGLAMPQAYVEIYSPWWKGLNLKLGHFYTTVGYESVRAPENFFYSHAYTMQYGEPFTHTGGLASFRLGGHLTGHVGITRGWDTWEDPNGKAGYLAGLSWAPNDVASLAFSMHTGREDRDGINNRTVYSLVYTRQLNCALQYVMQHDFGSEANGEFDANFAADSAKWYGINQYLFLDINHWLTAGLRVEWFRDQDNARVLAIPQESLVDGGNYTQVSFGLNARYHDKLVFRPEIRWDWSDVVATGLGGNGMFNDFTEGDQLTIAGDLIYKF